MGRAARSLTARFRRRPLKDDGVAGLVLGVQSVPDGLAGGLLAGVNPIFGLYAYMVGTASGALFTSATFMAVQATGAMAIVVADVPVVQGEDGEAALFTLAVLTGMFMLLAGVLRLGTLLRFVSNAVMVGFISAVGVNIILGQLDNFSGYEADGANRVARAADLLANLGEAHLASLAIGSLTIALIMVFERTFLGPLGLVVAIVVTSAIVAFSASDVIQLQDIVAVPDSLPTPVLPDLGAVPSLIVPGLALAFIGLVQGAGISSGLPNPDGRYPDASQDFIGQGVANVAVGLLRGMPVGGSMSASALVRQAGAQSKVALLVAAAVMAGIVLTASELVELIAMPALAGLLMLIGFRSIKPADLKAVWRTGSPQATVMTITFVFTMLIPLQTAVLLGVALSILLHVISVSNRVSLSRWVVDDEGLRETDPPAEVGRDEVLILQPYGSLFFASAAVFEDSLPVVTRRSRNSVVVLRLRGTNALGSTFVAVVDRYTRSLAEAECKLMLIYSDPNVRAQLGASEAVATIGEANLYESEQWLGRTMIAVHADASAWIDAHRDVDGDP
ncbi:MAG: SulP family inorganic anion transporter [Actinomycetota bacterium]